MTFHNNPEEFHEAIQAASQALNIREVVIEKDYWVSYVLKNLSESEYRDQVVFKGGTALSKAFTYIARFSEDIDLALLDNKSLGDAKRKSLFKKIESTITEGLKQIKNQPETLKRGKNRRTFYNYKKISTDSNWGALKDVIQLEINSFTDPIPNKEIEIKCLLYEFLKSNEFYSEITEYGMEPVVLNVLSMERTFSEKILSLIRLSYDGTDILRKKIRHFYDLHMIMDHNDILNSNTYEIINLARKDDETNPLFSGDWLNNPLSACPLFQNLEEVWNNLESTYNEELPQLCWLDEIPKSGQILESFSRIREFIMEFEKS